MNEESSPAYCLCSEAVISNTVPENALNNNNNSLDEGLNEQYVANATTSKEDTISAVDSSTLTELEDFIDISFQNINDSPLVKPANNFTNVISNNSGPLQQSEDDKLISMETRFSIFKNEIKSQIVNLSTRISVQDEIIETSKQELCKLRTDNLNLRSRIVELEEERKSPTHSVCIEKGKENTIKSAEQIYNDSLLCKETTQRSGHGVPPSCFEDKVSDVNSDVNAITRNRQSTKDLIPQPNKPWRVNNDYNKKSQLHGRNKSSSNGRGNAVNQQDKSGVPSSNESFAIPVRISHRSDRQISQASKNRKRRKQNTFSYNRENPNHFLQHSRNHSRPPGWKKYLDLVTRITHNPPPPPHPPQPLLQIPVYPPNRTPHW